MTDNNLGTETVNSLMSLVGGILSFIAVVVGIVYGSLKNAETAAARERVVSNALNAAAAGFPAVGIVLLLGFGAERAALWFIGSGTIFVSIEYLREKGPASRQQTAALVVSWCVMTSLVGLYFIGRVVQQMGQILNVLDKLTNALR